MTFAIRWIFAFAASAVTLTATTVAMADPLSSIGAGAVASVVIDQARNAANEVIDHATENGDYLLGMAGIQAKLALANIEDTANRQRAKTLEDLDKTTRENLARIRVTLDQAQRGMLDGAKAVQQITDSAAQLTNVLEKNGYRSYLMRYTPAVTYPGDPAPLVIQLRGVNLDQSNPVLHLPTGPLNALIQGKLDVAFQVPREVIGYEDNASKVLTLPLTYQSVKPGFFNGLFGRTESVKRELVILALPVRMGRFHLETTLETTVRIEKQEDYALPTFKGDNTDHKVAIQPPSGWKIDVSTLQMAPINGEQSQCKGFDQSKLFEDGVEALARTGHTGPSWKYPGGKPGFINCRVKYTLFKNDPATEPGPSADGELSWTADKVLELPAHLKSFLLTIKSFRGVSRSFAKDGGADFYDVSLDGDRVTVRPRIPAELSSQ